MSIDRWRPNYEIIDPNPGVPVRDSWLDAYKKGNTMWPQTIFPGIKLLCFEAVLNDPPADLDDFVDSKLNQDQVDELGALAAHAHSAYGVRLPYHSPLPGEWSDPSLTPSRLSAAWSQAADATGRALHWAVSTYPDYPQSKKFFDIYSSQVGELKGAAAIAARVLHEDVAVDFAKLHKLLRVKEGFFKVSEEGRKKYEDAEDLRRRMREIHDSIPGIAHRNYIRYVDLDTEEILLGIKGLILNSWKDERVDPGVIERLTKTGSLM